MIEHKEYFIKRSVFTNNSLKDYSIRGVTCEPHFYLHNLIFNDIQELFRNIIILIKKENIMNVISKMKELDFLKCISMAEFFTFTWDYYYYTRDYYYNIWVTNQSKFYNNMILLKQEYLHFLLYIYNYMYNDFSLKIVSKMKRNINIATVIETFENELGKNIQDYNLNKCFDFYLNTRKDEINFNDRRKRLFN